MIRVTIVRTDCRVLELERETWKAAAEAVVEKSSDDFYCPEKWFKIFATNPDRQTTPEEWKLRLLREDVAAGNVPDHS